MLTLIAKKNLSLFRQNFVVASRAPGMHSGRGFGVAAVQSSCSFICCSGMWSETCCSE